MPVYRRKQTTGQKVLSKAQRLTRERAIITDLRAGALSYRKIAVKHGVSLPTVNAKARKAGIRRSRRGPAALQVATRARAKTRRRTYVAKARTVARKVTRAKAPVATRTWSRTRPKATPRRVTRKTTGRSSRSPEQFNEQFRWLVMSYYPNMPLKRFERLTKLISKAIA